MRIADDRKADRRIVPAAFLLIRLEQLLVLNSTDRIGQELVMVKLRRSAHRRAPMRSLNRRKIAAVHDEIMMNQRALLLPDRRSRCRLLEGGIKSGRSRGDDLGSDRVLSEGGQGRNGVCRTVRRRRRHAARRRRPAVVVARTELRRLLLLLLQLVRAAGFQVTLNASRL